MGNPLKRHDSSLLLQMGRDGGGRGHGNREQYVRSDRRARQGRRSTPFIETLQDEEVHQPMGFPLSGENEPSGVHAIGQGCGVDGIELNFDLDNDLSPKSGTKEYHAIRKMADEIGIAISGLCSFLFWPYPLTSNDPKERKRGMELAAR